MCGWVAGAREREGERGDMLICVHVLTLIFSLIYTRIYAVLLDVLLDLLLLSNKNSQCVSQCPLNFFSFFLNVFFYLQFC